MHLAVSIFLILSFVFLFSMLIAWFVISDSVYSGKSIVPGEQYELANRTYVLPAHLRVEGEIYLLKDDFVLSLRKLIVKVSYVLDKMGVEYWLTGGSLLGAVRHNAIPMCTDDDIDMGIHVKDKERLFSAEFTNECALVDLNTLYFFNNDENVADKIGAAVRVQLDSGPFYKTCTCDLFFYETDKIEQKIYKLDGWDGDETVRSTKEIHNINTMFPLQHLNVDGIDVNIPKQPKTVLITQYGNDVLEVVKTRPRLVCHQLPFRMFHGFFPRRPTSWRSQTKKKIT